jgi:hypothetical protein
MGKERRREGRKEGRKERGKEGTALVGHAMRHRDDAA